MFYYSDNLAGGLALIVFDSSIRIGAVTEGDGDTDMGIENQVIW